MSVVSAVLLDRLRARGTGSFGNRTSLFTHFTYFTVRYTRLTDCTWTVHYTVPYIPIHLRLISNLDFCVGARKMRRARYAGCFRTAACPVPYSQHLTLVLTKEATRCKLFLTHVQRSL